jgi:GMP synthase (glutamine-hydrolysing)
MAQEKIVILYCGSSFTKHLYDSLMSLKTLPIMVPHNTSAEDILSLGDIKGIIITGSGQDPLHPHSPKVDQEIYELNIPVLGICYGMQRMAIDLGGTVKRMPYPEREAVELYFDEGMVESDLYQDFVDEGALVWMSHTLKVTQEPPNFLVTGYTDDSEIASMEHQEREIFAVQFHPEQKGSGAGTLILWRWLQICGCQG